MSVDLFGMFVLPSASEIVNEILKGGAKEVGAQIVRRLLRVRCDHQVCGEKFDADICNHERNPIECPNCHTVLRQFTNVCSFTLKKTGQIAHVGINLSGTDWEHDESAEQIKITGGEYLFVGLRGQVVVERNYLRDYQTSKLFSTDKFLWTPETDFYLTDMTLIGHSEQIPDKYNINDREFAIDTELKSKYGDLLCEDRDVLIWDEGEDEDDE